MWRCSQIAILPAFVILADRLDWQFTSAKLTLQRKQGDGSLEHRPATLDTSHDHARMLWSETRVTFEQARTMPQSTPALGQRRFQNHVRPLRIHSAFLKETSEILLSNQPCLFPAAHKTKTKILPEEKPIQNIGALLVLS